MNAPAMIPQRARTGGSGSRFLVVDGDEVATGIAVSEEVTSVVVMFAVTFADSGGRIAILTRSIDFMEGLLTLIT